MVIWTAPTGEVVIPDHSGPNRRRTRTDDRAYRIALEWQRIAARISRNQLLVAEHVAKEEPPL